MQDTTYLPGDLIHDRYEVETIKHISGLGVVYRIRDTHEEIPGPLALKESITFPSAQRTVKQRIERFMEKTELLTTLDHPAIPQVYDYFAEEDMVYTVMQYIDGADLEELLEIHSPIITVEAVTEWAHTIADTLHYLHTYKPNPIIYRDLKPPNIMYQHERVVLIDFGIAGCFPRGVTLDPLGTDGYAAPEQYRGVVNPRIDIYALGATMHHLLTGKDPRMERPFSFQDRYIPFHNPAVPERLDAIVTKALANEPGDRYVTAADMRDALAALM